MLLPYRATVAVPVSKTTPSAAMVASESGVRRGVDLWYVLPVERSREGLGASAPKGAGSMAGRRALDLPLTLDWTGVRAQERRYEKNGQIYSQGDPAAAVMFIAEGDVRLSVVSHEGKEAILALLSKGHFFGEGCLVRHPVRISTATAMSRTHIMAIERREMTRVMHERPAFADAFLAHMINRNIRIEEDLVDQLFNSIEKRLARALLLLARYGEATETHRSLPRVSQELLAEMVGTTRTRINFFMTRFRRLGFIEYNGVLKVNNSLLTVVLSH